MNVVPFTKPSGLPDGAIKELELLLLACKEGRCEAFVIASIVDKEYEVVHGSDISDSIVLATILRMSSEGRMRS